MKGVVAQFVLAALAIIALVVVNIWGKESEVLTTTLASVITAAIWGGLQRKQGMNHNRPLRETDEEAE